MESLKLTGAKVRHLEENLDSLTVGRLDTDLQWLRLRVQQLKTVVNEPDKADDARRLIDRIDLLISDIQAELGTERRHAQRSALAAHGYVDPELDGDDI
jgi:hypothetical protein